MPWKKSKRLNDAGMEFRSEFVKWELQTRLGSGFPWVCFNCLQGKQTILFLLL